MRLNYVLLGICDIYYMRILLTVQKDCTIYESIMTVNRIIYPNFQDAFYSLELLYDDRKFITAINEVWSSIEKTICDEVKLCSTRTFTEITYPSFQDALYFMKLLCDDRKFITAINEVWSSIEKTDLFLYGYLKGELGPWESMPSCYLRCRPLSFVEV
ncbi:hypothetical protein Ahy_B10g103724 [Arachis hypogaea]|uniref:Uncharacterized protein n=1 Tax=Arachis hypogaea TaxID=3818 RepID=A0A444X3V4_ARAHY|nr:hypothetical protein Ahy_B10g103724 [Arachis hypogaea]